MAARKRSIANRPGLPVIRPNVAGIDLGSTEHWVCGPVGKDDTVNVRVFRTTTPQLAELAAWLKSQGVESVAMESTHVYWIPVYELLESQGFEVLLVNARQVRSVPGRKTDMQDCQWIQLLHSCGLLRGSFRPSDAICRIRAIQRQASNLVAQRTRCVQWMQKALDQMNVQVHRAVTDITGHTGMSIIRAIVAGERDPEKLASFRHGRCRKTAAEIAEHLTGNWRAEHLFNLESALQLFEQLEEMLERYESRVLEEIESLQPPERKNLEPGPHPSKAKQIAMKARGEQELRTILYRFSGVDLTRIDGISAPSARLILSEVGFDLDKFPSESHFAAWLRLVPRMAVSGGKVVRKKTHNGTGANRIAGALRMAALSLQRSDTALGAFFRKTARRKGGRVAVFATARKLAILVFRMLRYGQEYTDVGAEEYDRQFEQARLKRLTNSARQLGFQLVPTQVA